MNKQIFKAAIDKRGVRQQADGLPVTLSGRLRGCLWNNNLMTTDDVQRAGLNCDLLRLPNFGLVCLNELLDLLSALGYSDEWFKRECQYRKLDPAQIAKKKPSPTKGRSIWFTEAEMRALRDGSRNGTARAARAKVADALSKLVGEAA